jgi:hypothetical protein
MIRDIRPDRRATKPGASRHPRICGFNAKAQREKRKLGKQKAEMLCRAVSLRLGDFALKNRSYPWFNSFGCRRLRWVLASLRWMLPEAFGMEAVKGQGFPCFLLFHSNGGQLSQ